MRKFAIIGNNDGPLRLVNSLSDSAQLDYLQVVGLQKELTGDLKKDYATIQSVDVVSGFDEERLMEILLDYEVEVIINCFANLKFTRLLEKYECYNIHPSYLPFYRGRHPIHWALISGAGFHGISMHRMTPQYDRGQIIWQAKIPLARELSVAQVRAQLIKQLEKGFPKALDRVLNLKINHPIQDTIYQKKDYWPRRYPSDSLLVEWSAPDLIYRKIKALSSEDNPAFIELRNGKKLNVINVYELSIDGLGKNISSYPQVTFIGKGKLNVELARDKSFELSYDPSYHENLQIKDIIL